MGVDTTQIGVNTAEIMEHLGETYADDDTAVVTEVITIVMVSTDLRPTSPEWDEIEEGEAVEDEGGTYSHVHFRASTPMWVHQLGLVEAARWAIKENRL
jgi:hypothetical protein